MADISPTSSTAQPVPADAPRHLYLDFGRNADRLTEVLHSLRRAHAGRFLPDAGSEILRGFVDTVFPEAMSQTYAFCNASLKPGFAYLTIRPVGMGPRLEAAFPRGLVPCIHGNPHPNLGLSPVVTVNGIALIAAGSPRPFEQERTTRLQAYPRLCPRRLTGGARTHRGRLGRLAHTRNSARHDALAPARRGVARDRRQGGLAGRQLPRLPGPAGGAQGTRHRDHGRREMR